MVVMSPQLAVGPYQSPLGVAQGPAGKGHMGAVMVSPSSLPCCSPFLQVIRNILDMAWPVSHNLKLCLPSGYTILIGYHTQ